MLCRTARDDDETEEIAGQTSRTDDQGKSEEAREEAHEARHEKGHVASGKDPWAITRPTLISVSGGRSSMYMLRRYLDRHDGKLPEQAAAVFCNTGKEHPKTLDFVQRCSTEWDCPIVWLEYRSRERYEVVSHNSASRSGEPFAVLIQDKGTLPRSGMRFCTEELKINTCHRWACRSWGHVNYDKAVGYRPDEPSRVAKERAICGKTPKPWVARWPMYDEGIATRQFIIDWWSTHQFDIRIPTNRGNCDLCFLKGRHKRAEAIADEPAIADWWIEQQLLTGRFFTNPRRPLHDYRDLRRWALSDAPKPWKQGDVLDGLDALDIECACTD